MRERWWRRRLTIGRLAVYVEPRDAWIGVYVAADAVYVCLLPFLAIRWSRGAEQRRWSPPAPVYETTGRQVCPGCWVRPGEPHEYSCPQVPADWFLENVVRRAR